VKEAKPPKLESYRKKRRAEATNEPFGGEVRAPQEAEGGEGAGGARSKGTLSGAYVVHLHDATRRHYDLRLEVGGVLASFAVPRGMSLDPETKHLAVNTEDHPIEYLDFEDVIPDGQYGAGPMIAWDRGEVVYLEGPAEEEIASGKIHVELRGQKLHGRWALVKLAKSDKGNEWLLFKKNDAYASRDRVLIDELPASVLSGLTVEELAGARAIGEHLVERARAAGGRPATAADVSALLAADRSPLLATAAPTDPTDRKETLRERARRTDDVVYDADLGGVRVLATREGDAVSLRVFGEGGAEDVDAFYPEIVRAIRALPVPRLALDGELLTFDQEGKPNVARLQARAVRLSRGDVHGAVTAAPVTFVVKDVLLLGDVDLRPAPLRARREVLEALLPRVGFLRAAPWLEGALPGVLAACSELGVAAVIGKRASAPYAAEPSAGAGRGKKGATTPAWFVVWRRDRGPHAGEPPVDHAAVMASADAAPPSIRSPGSPLPGPGKPGGAGPERRVVVTNRAKIFWPDEGYTKGDLCDYYETISDVALRYVGGRPVILVRYPDGVNGKSFFQWNVPPGMPAWVRTIEIPHDEGPPRRGFLVDDPATLLYIANLGTIPLHILGCRASQMSQADFLTLDFDVKQSTFACAVTLATTLREILDDIGLPGFPKTSGQTGLHVLVPLGGATPGATTPSRTPPQRFETARALADLLGTLLVQRHPDIATMDRVVRRRGPKVYVDTGQTGPTRAIVAPYSVRAAPGATVSTPITWDELPTVDPRAFTIRTVPGRIARMGDPMAAMLDCQPDVGAAVARLSARFSRPDGGPP